MHKRRWKLSGGSRAGKIKLIFIILGVVVVGGGGAAVFLLKGRAAETETGEGEAGEGEAVAGKQEPAQIVELGEFLANLTSQNQLRYLQMEVALSIRGEGLEGEGGGHGGEAKPELPREDLLKAKDVIVAKASAQKFATLRTPTGKQQFKETLKKALGQALPDYQIEEVLFVSFVMQ